MMKHSIIAVLILLLVASLVFAAEPVGTVTYDTGSVTTTANGMTVTNQAVTVPLMQQAPAKPVRKAAEKPVARPVKVTSAQATQAANEASLKKAEPKLKVNKTTTTTDVYDVSVTNKKGTTNYVIDQQTVTNDQGTSQTEGVIYSSYSPSKAARANEKSMELSLAGGFNMFYNKDSQKDRYGKTGLIANMNLLKDLCTHLAIGLDYMMLHPGHQTHDGRHYHGHYAHNIALAGKFTLNPWDNVQVYVPMGFGMMNARMKTNTDANYFNENKWGASMYAGLGVQYDITAGLFAGLEYRYVYGWISDKDLTPYHKDRDLQYHNLMLRLGMRF